MPKSITRMMLPPPYLPAIERLCGNSFIIPRDYSPFIISSIQDVSYGHIIPLSSGHVSVIWVLLSCFFLRVDSMKRWQLSVIKHRNCSAITAGFYTRTNSTLGSWSMGLRKKRKVSWKQCLHLSYYHINEDESREKGGRGRESEIQKGAEREREREGERDQDRHCMHY